jgi:2-phospho-L-lactate guanylyltransferase (CobY/MobA/RfbA family)
MPPVVVPFRREGGKSRLGLGSVVAEAMLADVLGAASALGPAVVADGEGGQGTAVVRALQRFVEGPVLVVNADLPCATARDLITLAGSIPPGGLAVVEARDGTTNALGLSSPHLFVDLYGRGSAARFLAQPRAVSVTIPNLVDDVDTPEDLERLGSRVGPHTALALAGVPA